MQLKLRQTEGMNAKYAEYATSYFKICRMQSNKQKKKKKIPYVTKKKQVSHNFFFK